MPHRRHGDTRRGVLTIIDEEFSACRRVFDADQEVPGTPHYRPDRKGVVIRQAADRSNVPALGMTLKLIEDYRPELVILVGIAGDIAGRSDVAPGVNRSGDAVLARLATRGAIYKWSGVEDLVEGQLPPAILCPC